MAQTGLGPRKLIPVKGSSKFLTIISDRVKLVKTNNLYTVSSFFALASQSAQDW